MCIYIRVHLFVDASEVITVHRCEPLSTLCQDAIITWALVMVLGSMLLSCACLQLQALLGEAHVNIVTAKEVALTAKHVCLIMEFAAGGSMTSYVAKKSQGSTAAAAEGQLFMTEDEARYFYRVRLSEYTKPPPDLCGCNAVACVWQPVVAHCRTPHEAPSVRRWRPISSPFVMRKRQ